MERGITQTSFSARPISWHNFYFWGVFFLFGRSRYLKFRDCAIGLAWEVSQIIARRWVIVHGETCFPPGWNLKFFNAAQGYQLIPHFHNVLNHRLLRNRLLDKASIEADRMGADATAIVGRGEEGVAKEGKEAGSRWGRTFGSRNRPKRHRIPLLKSKTRVTLFNVSALSMDAVEAVPFQSETLKRHRVPDWHAQFTRLMMGMRLSRVDHVGSASLLRWFRYLPLPAPGKWNSVYFSKDNRKEIYE